MNKRLWIVFAVLVLVALGGLVFWKKGEDSKIDTTADAYDGSKLLVKADVGDGQIPDHYSGNKDAKVIVIEYEDFACSHCNAFSDTAAAIKKEYANDVLFVYRNFNLKYPNSTISESAAEAAYLIGGEEAYWKMHDLLFSENAWTSSAIPTKERRTMLEGYAETAGLDVDKFMSAVEDYENNGIQAKINRDKALGTKAEVTGTPTWFVNGKKIDSITESNVKSALKDALNEVGKSN